MKKKKKIKSGWKDYLSFSLRERRGLTVLILILFVQIIVLFSIDKIPFSISSADHIYLTAMLDELEKKEVTFLPPEKNSPPEYFYFNPNNPDSASWPKLGFTASQIKMISRFLAKGGSFRKKEDLQKMYCITPEFYKTISPFINIPQPESRHEKTFYKKKITDIGTADSLGLDYLRGIGPALSSRIIKYRESLGGFCNIAQLQEVYGISDSLYESLVPAITLGDTIPFRFIHLNTDSAATMAAHPYIRWKLASVIVNYRKQHGAFTTIAGIQGLPLVTPEIFRKLAPYLKAD